MLKRTQRCFIAITVFIIGVLIFTRLDYLINSDFYGYGLQFSAGWFGIYSILYFALYQILLVCLLLYARNTGLFVVLEAFVLSSGQDLVYFGVWNGGVFPSGSWSWMPAATILKFWSTSMQVSLTVGVTSTALIGVFLVGRHRKLFF